MKMGVLRDVCGCQMRQIQVAHGTTVDFKSSLSSASHAFICGVGQYIKALKLIAFSRVQSCCNWILHPPSVLPRGFIPR